MGVLTLWGYLQAACTALDFLCNKALEQKSFQWKKPVYHEEVRKGRPLSQENCTSTYGTLLMGLVYLTW